MMLVERGFGYLEGDSGERLFFHRNEWLGRPNWSRLTVGTVVTYLIGENNRGPCAVVVLAGNAVV